MPLIGFAVVKAVGLVSQAGPVLSEWNRLEPDEKAAVQQDAARVKSCLGELRRLLGARVFGDNTDELDWDEARQLALDPPQEFRLAQHLVEVLVTSRSADELSLRATVEEAGFSVNAFEEALEIARDDRYIEPVDPKSWAITDFADRDLADGDQVRYVEQEIVQHISEVGLAARDELAISAGAADFDSVEFQEGLERALVTGAVQWLGWGLYGLPPHRLKTFEPSQPSDEQFEEPRDVKEVLSDLKRSTEGLRDAIRRVQQTSKRPSRGPSVPQLPASTAPTSAHVSSTAPSAHHAPAAVAPDPLEMLGKLKSLHDAGVLTDEEFSAKKAELLAQI